MIPYMTVSYHMSHPSGAVCPSSIARQPRRCQCRTIRLQKALGDMIPTPTFVAPTLYQLLPWKYRPWKIGPGGVIYTVVHSSYFRDRGPNLVNIALRGHPLATYQCWHKQAEAFEPTNFYLFRIKSQKALPTNRERV